VRAARTGDRDAFGQLVRRHLEAAHGAASALLADPADAEDVVQDAFVGALERLESCRPEEKFRGWLLVSVRNRALDLLRRQRVRRALPLDAPPEARAPELALLSSAGPGPAVEAERGDARVHLAAALATLTETRRTVVLLHDVEGWTHREIADQLGVAEGTVRAHLFWARRALRERLSAEWRRESDV
jgi:RNA polymerase sigma-70 factor (ECF subfamily)